MKNKRWTVLATAALAYCFASETLAQGPTLQRHLGDADPLTENFAYWPFNGAISTLAIPDDNGFATWQVQNAGSTWQAAYIQAGGTGPWVGGSGLTQAQIDAINLDGFTLSMRARVLSGPVYEETGSQLISGVASLAGFSGFRFDIGLGLNASGDTVVVLPDLVNYVGGQFMYDPHGAPLVVPGTGYHLYQLSYEPNSATALLLIDGVVKATGYPGSAVGGGTVANNFGLGFGSLNLSTSNFADVRLQSGHVTATSTLRNAGSNPVSYTASAPALGAAWTASVDLSLTGHTHAQVLGHAGPANVVLPGGQVMLMGGPRRFKLPLRSAPASWSVPVPLDPSLAGRKLYSQAAHLFGVTPFALSNAQDMVVGY